MATCFVHKVGWGKFEQIKPQSLSNIITSNLKLCSMTCQNVCSFFCWLSNFCWQVRGLTIHLAPQTVICWWLCSHIVGWLTGFTAFHCQANTIYQVNDWLHSHNTSLTCHGNLFCAQTWLWQVRTARATKPEQHYYKQLETMRGVSWQTACCFFGSQISAGRSGV